MIFVMLSMLVFLCGFIEGKNFGTQGLVIGALTGGIFALAAFKGMGLLMYHGPRHVIHVFGITKHSASRRWLQRISQFCFWALGFAWCLLCGFASVWSTQFLCMLLSAVL